MVKRYDIQSKFPFLKKEQVSKAMTVDTCKGIIAAFAREVHASVLHDWLVAFFQKRLLELELPAPKIQGAAPRPRPMPPPDVPRPGADVPMQPRVEPPKQALVIKETVEDIRAELQQEQERFELAKLKLQRAQIRQQRARIEEQLAGLEPPGAEQSEGGGDQGKQSQTWSDFGADLFISISRRTLRDPTSQAPQGPQRKELE